jgi:hypothetical protein
MNVTWTRSLIAVALLLCVAFAVPKACATQAQTQSDDAASSTPETTVSSQDKPEAKPADKNSAKAKPAEDESPANAGTEALQKATQNPVASLISVPIQNNNNFSISPGNRTQDVLNLQPVVPIGISKDWNLIVRWIVPIIYQPLPVPPANPQTGVYGFGDMVPTFFLSPKKPGKLIWGLGPVFQLPTATSTYLGQGKLGIGPSAVALMQPGHWTLGVLFNNVWSVAGSGSRPSVNQFLLQYFINYNLKKGWSLSMSPTITANWQASSGNVWTVPVGAGVARVFRAGYQPMNASVAFFGNAVHPVAGSPWGMRLQISFLFPKRPGAAGKN